VKSAKRLLPFLVWLLFLNIPLGKRFMEPMHDNEFLLAQERHLDVLTRTTSKTEKRKQVSVYVTSWCPSCRSAEKFLRRHKVPFTRYDVEKNGAAKKRYEQFGTKKVPVIQIGSRYMIGFHESRLRKLLQIPK
jgi:mycoredoxin